MDSVIWAQYIGDVHNMYNSHERYGLAKSIHRIRSNSVKYRIHCQMDVKWKRRREQLGSRLIVALCFETLSRIYFSEMYKLRLRGVQ